MPPSIPLKASPTPTCVRCWRALAAGDSEPPVRAAARQALEHVEQRLALWGILGNVFQGVSLGSVLLLAAIGLAITFGVMGVINMAHGELMMLGAYTTYRHPSVPPICAERLRLVGSGGDPDRLPRSPGWSASLIERSVIRFLYGRPLETLLATFGLSLILQQAVRTIFGRSNRAVGNPSWMSGAVDLDRRCCP